MSSCSLVIVHASLKNMVSRETRLKFLVPKTACFRRLTYMKVLFCYSWFIQYSLRLFVELIFFHFLHIDFLTHLQEKLPLNLFQFSFVNESMFNLFLSIKPNIQKFTLIK